MKSYSFPSFREEQGAAKAESEGEKLINTNKDKKTSTTLN